jgi:hypothetical protein
MSKGKKKKKKTKQKQKNKNKNQKPKTKKKKKSPSPYPSVDMLKKIEVCISWLKWALDESSIGSSVVASDNSFGRVSFAINGEGRLKARLSTRLD